MLNLYRLRRFCKSGHIISSARACELQSCSTLNINEVVVNTSDIIISKFKKIIIINFLSVADNITTIFKVLQLCSSNARATTAYNYCRFIFFCVTENEERQLIRLVMRVHGDANYQVSISDAQSLIKKREKW